MTRRIVATEEFGAIHQPTANAVGLPAQAYTSSDWMEFERDNILSSSWLCIGYIHDLPPSSAKPVELMGLPLVVVKNPKGEVQVFHNVCRHRGHRLVQKACLLQGSIRCPYHSWTYNFDGSLSGTPNIGGHGVHQVKDFDPGEHSLFSIRSVDWMGMLFINLDAEALSFGEFIAPLETRWSRFTGSHGLACARPVKVDGWMEIVVEANWKLVVENYCESYHLPWIHPQLNSYSRIEDHYNILAGDWGAGQGTTVFDFSEHAGIHLPTFPDWPENEKKVAEYIALFPNVLLGLQVDHFYAIVLLPLTFDRTIEQVQIYYVGEEALAVQYAEARRVLLEGWRGIFFEDISPIEGMQRGRESPVFDGGVFSPVLDTATHHFHKWIASRLPHKM